MSLAMSLLTKLPPPVLNSLLSLYTTINTRLKPYSKAQTILLGLLLPTIIRFVKNILIGRVAKDVCHTLGLLPGSNGPNPKLHETVSGSHLSGIHPSLLISEPTNPMSKFNTILYHYFCELKSFSASRSVWLAKKYLPKFLVVDKINEEKTKMTKQFEHELGGDQLATESFLTLPEKGVGVSKIREILKSRAAGDEVHWKSGKVSGTVYHGSDELQSLMGDAYRLSLLSNPLHSDVFNNCRQMEAEVVSMVSGLGDGSGGCEYGKFVFNNCSSTSQMEAEVV